tara:strand:+ start:29 stop:619 length:591 start_codon:yes stop_codon:yes gene_type:complete
MKSKKWLERNKKDIYSKKAKLSGYVSRAAYKLFEIDNKYSLISKAKNILELGSAPGGWSQAIFEKNNNAQVSGFDLLDMKFNHPNFKFFKQNFLEYKFLDIENKFDLVLSDIAPNTSGHKSTDHLRICSLIEEIINLLDDIALKNSSLIIKIWKGSEEYNIINNLKAKYKKISYFKPKSSHSESSEIFIVAQNFIN